MWSPDGRQIAFVRGIDSNHLAICTIDVSGANEVRRAVTFSPRGTVGRVDWSPDGKYLLTSDRRALDAPNTLALISLANGEKRWITAPPAASAGDADGTFAPDGRLIAFRRTRSDSVEDVYTIPYNPDASPDAGLKRVTFGNISIRGHTWAPDGRSIIASSRIAGGLHNLWRFPLNGGKPTALTEADHTVILPAVSRRGGRIAWQAEIFDANIWERPTQSGGAAKILIGSAMIDTSPQFSPDGKRIAFRSDRTGANEIWVAAADGSGATQLTRFNGPLTGCPRWSPDGGALAYDSRRGENADIFIQPADGGPERRFTTEPSSEVAPSWSRDGKWIYFASDRSGQWQVWKQPVAAGSAQQLTTHGGFAAFESADGRYVYYSKSPPLGGIYRTPVDGGPEEALLPDVPGEMWGNWALGSRGIYFLEFQSSIRPYHAAVLFYDLATKERHEIGNTSAIPVRWDSGLALAPDERTLLYTQVDRFGSSIFIAEGFR
jgi:Tol biopolymer transport system component